MSNCSPETIHVSRVCNIAACLRLDNPEIPSFLRDHKEVDQCSQQPAIWFCSVPDELMRVKSHTRLTYPLWTDHTTSTKEFQNKGNQHFGDVISFWPWGILGTDAIDGTRQAT